MIESEKEFRACRLTRAGLWEALKREEEKVRTLERERKWHPIATAPKDGSEILIYAPGCKILFKGEIIDGPKLARFGMAMNRPAKEGPCWTNVDCQWIPWAFGPTHWMPLPEIPLFMPNKNTPTSPPSLIRDEPLGRAAYEAYCHARAWKNDAGRQLPPWNKLETAEQRAWMRSAKAAVQLAVAAATA